MDWNDVLPPDLPPRIKVPELARRLNLSVEAIKTMVNAGTLSPPVKLTQRIHVFDTETVRRELRRLSDPE